VSASPHLQQDLSGAAAEARLRATSLHPALPWLVGTLLASALGMAIAASVGLAATTVACAALFVIIIIAAAGRTNPTLPERQAADHAVTIARRNARLAALTYAWAGLALQSVYFTPLTGLRWQHGWQYGLAFMLLALGTFGFAFLLGDSRRPALADRLARLIGPLTTGQALLAATGAAYLAGSGKLLSARADWAANIVFAFAALALMVVSALALRSHARLTRS
jgi:hypothetical protein